MIIPLAIVIGLHIQGKPTPLERDFIDISGAYENQWQKLLFRKQTRLEFEEERIYSDLSKKFESMAITFGNKRFSLESWMMALMTSPRDQKRENYLLNRILSFKPITAEQSVFYRRWEKMWMAYAHTFVISSKVINLVDMFEPLPKSKAEKASLLMRKASWMDDTNDLKWDVYDRLVSDYAGTDSAVLARQIILKRKHLESGDQFPDFISKDSNGKKFQLSELEGKVVVLEFWANWCPSCQRTIPVMQGVEKQFAGKPIEFIGINSDGDAPVVKEIQAKWGMTTRTLVDGSPTGPISTRYAIMAWPSFFVIGKDGIVVYRSAGIDSDGLTSAIQRALN